MVLLQQLETTPEYENFLFSIKSEETKKKYSYALKRFAVFINRDLLLHEGKQHQQHQQQLNPKEIEDLIIKYILHLRKEGKSYSTINAVQAAIIHFYTMNDIVLNTKKIGKYKGEFKKIVKDRGYTIAEIKKLVDACSLKYKVIVTIMTSTGCRVGAISSLKIRDLKLWKKDKLYQIYFYSNTKDEYFSFTTPECSTYIDQYLEYRKRCGETLNLESPLIRTDFQTDDMLHIENPKHNTTHTFKYYLREKLVETGIRNPNKQKDRASRHEISANHGIRKFTHTTMANAKINVEIREMLLGHSIGLSAAYYRPTESEMLLEYLKVVNNLTIDPSNRLQKQVQELKEQDDYQKYVIDKKIKEKDEEIAKMRQAMKTVLDTVDEMKNDFIVQQKKKLEKDKKIEDDFSRIESRLFETQMLALKMDEIEQKRQKIFAKKGFVTKEDEEAIKNSIIEDVKQNDPDLWHMLFERQQQQQEQEQ
jgi:integrase